MHDSERSLILFNLDTYTQEKWFTCKTLELGKYGQMVPQNELKVFLQGNGGCQPRICLMD